MNLVREPQAIVQSVHEAEIREVNALEQRIVKSEDDADAKLWEQARQVVALLEAGMSQRALASQWVNARTGEAYSAMHVMRTARAFACNVNVTPRPRFRDAYNEVANAKRKAAPVNIDAAEGDEYLAMIEFIGSELVEIENYFADKDFEMTREMTFATISMHNKVAELLLRLQRKYGQILNEMQHSEQP